MNSQSTPGPRQRRNSVRHQARLDPDTSTKLEELASTCHRKRSAILRYVIQWGITHAEGWIIDRSPVVAVPPVAVLLEAELLQQVQDAAAARGVSMTAWLREAVRQVSVHDLPASWRTDETAERSHDSGYYERSSGDWSEKPVRRSGDCGDNSHTSLREHFSDGYS